MKLSRAEIILGNFEAGWAKKTDGQKLTIGIAAVVGAVLLVGIFV